MYLKTTAHQLSLVILAGGICERYKGQKQIEKVGPSKECLMEYAIYDAFTVGITHFVFIVNQYFDNNTRKYFQRIFEKKGASVEFVLQTTHTAVPRNYFDDLNQRNKPWGTGHALLVAKNHLSNPFIVINADDYYGRSAFNAAKLMVEKQEITPNRYGIVSYLLNHTLSDNGGVSKGICKINQQILHQIEEFSNIFRYEDKIIFEEEHLSGVIPNDTQVSMNFWVLHPSIFRALEDKFDNFMRNHSKELQTSFHLPRVINELIYENKTEVAVTLSQEKCFGITYPEDKLQIEEQIQLKITTGIYPRTLWM